MHLHRHTRLEHWTPKPTHSTRAEPPFHHCASHHDHAFSFIDTRDIAAVAVEALLGDHDGREYALTGPQSLTFTDLAAACRDSTIPIEQYQPVSEEEFRRAALDLGWHPDYVNTLTSLFATIDAGHAAPVLPDTAEVLGRAPRPVTEFVRAAR